MSDAEDTARTFKTAWFSKAARKARITDKEVCGAVRAAQKGQADDLGGGVFKKRLDKNRHRNVILAKGGRYWVYQYLFAKKDRANIDEKELIGFRNLAKAFEGLNDLQIDHLLKGGDFTEICHGSQE